MASVGKPRESENSYTLATVPFNERNKGRTTLLKDVSALGYNDGFHWRSAADNSILNTANSAFLSNSSYRNYQDSPLLAGDLTQLKSVCDGSTFKDLLILGDSQETTPGGFGGTFIPALNLEAFKLFGPATKTPWYSLSSFDSQNTFVVSGVIAEASFTTEDDTHPPAVRVKTTTGTGLGPLATLSPDGGLNTVLTDFGGNYFPNDTGTLNYEFIAHTNSSGPAEIRIRQTTRDIPRNYFGTLEQDLIYNATDMSASDDVPVKISVGPLIHNEARPFINIYSQGWDGSAVQLAHQMSVARFTDTSRDQGVSFTTWSVGGQSVSNLLTTRANMGPTFQAAGPWDAVLVTLGTNDAGNGANTPAVQKASYQSLIDTIRTWAGNSNQFIVLVSEPPRDTFSSGSVDNFNKYGSILGELAEENSNVAFVTFRETTFR